MTTSENSNATARVTAHLQEQHGVEVRMVKVGEVARVTGANGKRVHPAEYEIMQPTYEALEAHLVAIVQNAERSSRELYEGRPAKTVMLIREPGIIEDKGYLIGTAATVVLVEPKPQEEGASPPDEQASEGEHSEG